ncbi:MAG: dienelactone hydrolase family protein [Ignavibacteriaceae bacterium]
MKTIYSIMLIMLFSAGIAFAQEAKSCCNNEKYSETTVSFASFGSDSEFREGHQLPAEFNLINPKGKMIKISVSGAEDANAYYIESAKKTNKYVFVIHEWWGLNDHIKREADALKEELGDVNILALDLYDGKVAANREDAAKLMQAADPDRVKQIFEGAFNFAGESSEIGTIGWCFGGGWSLQMSIWLGENGKACVMYYGIIDNTPETFNNLNAPVLGIFARQDGWINPEVYGNLESNLKAAGKLVTIHEYDADHAFANPSNQQFDETATNDAKKHVIRFLKTNLMN